MKNSVFWTFRLLLLIFIAIPYCGYREGDWGATVGDCDEICTVYYVAQRELMKKYEIYDKNFPNKDLRRKHVKVFKNGHKIDSWFFMVNGDGDTSWTNFSCEVYLSSDVDVGYFVENLKIE